ncbi:hypothetical protein L6452_01642 [Arctium lappa]|uniref:Uncharacterized protein n=1 Tax=Arctium lappa TaxID=4217 RepID=A0ACB9FI39_ARCLA|nr:hypothetical protein L6452_01642 [Arctium lappa]
MSFSPSIALSHWSSLPIVLAVDFFSFSYCFFIFSICSNNFFEKLSSILQSFFAKVYWSQLWKISESRFQNAEDRSFNTLRYIQRRSFTSLVVSLSLISVSDISKVFSLPSGRSLCSSLLLLLSLQSILQGSRILCKKRGKIKVEIDLKQKDGIW